MAKETAALPISVFFSRLFGNFHKLIFTNLLFAVPFAASFALFWFLSRFAGSFSNAVLFLTIIPVFPFYAGVTRVCAKLSQGQDVAIFDTFLSAVKENFVRFIIQGLICFAAVFFSYWSISLYAGLGSVNFIFYVLMAISIIIALFFLFAFYYIPTMTVTFDISMKNIYKNSALMTFGEIKSNIIATFGLFLLMVVSTTIVLCFGMWPVAIAISTAVICTLIVPSVASFIINSAVYPRMYAMITDNKSQNKAVDKKLSDKRSEMLDLKARQQKKEIDEELKTLDIDASADGDEYIYYKGRMMKRSVLLKLREEAKESEEN